MHEVERFNVRSDVGKYENTIVVYQEMIDAPTRANPRGTIPGLMNAVTVDGYNCNRLDERTFEIVQLGMVVRRIN